jgi:hypothetical protein
MQLEGLESAEAPERQLVLVGCNSEPREIVNNQRKMWQLFRGLLMPRRKLGAQKQPFQVRSASHGTTCRSRSGTWHSRLARRKVALGGTGNTNVSRSRPAWANADGRAELALRDREARSSLTNHVCFLRETGSCGLITRNMEETGILEKADLSGSCYLTWNQAFF